MYRIGQKVMMTENAIENYGEKYRDVIFVITHRATKYMPAKQFYAENMPSGYHPGYDEGVGNQALYDLKLYDSDIDFNNSLYSWELSTP